ncbi:Hypothetical_protein [Hexamita inflata]|uniref:Hypothetical_protein n=1 Tax=Hexamita inflata TaxID=28002 RepID=A0AA86UT82_9EUKA|nr:Hypothetical protein HINF_LOCUS54734 [Hexamita inflata]
MSVLMRRENTLIIEPGSDISKIQIINFILLPNSKKHFEGPPLYPAAEPTPCARPQTNPKNGGERCVNGRPKPRLGAGPAVFEVSRLCLRDHTDRTSALASAVQRDLETRIIFSRSQTLDLIHVRAD